MSSREFWRRRRAGKSRASLQRYANRSGNSGVSAYRIGDEWIDVRFVSGDIYRYDVGTVGKGRFLEMQKLAKRGRGLATYISRHVHDRYSARLRAKVRRTVRTSGRPKLSTT